MSMIDGIDRLFRDIADLSGASLKRLTDMETGLDDRVASLRDGSLVSFIRIRGHQNMVGHDEFELGKGGLASSLDGFLKTSGHTVAFFYRYNPFDKSMNLRCASGMKSSARAMMLDMDDVVDDWEGAVSRYTRSETITLAVYTRLGVLSGYSQDALKKEIAKGDYEAPFRGDVTKSQRVAHFAARLMDRHNSFVLAVMDILSSPQVRVVAEMRSPRDILIEARRRLSPDCTGDDWSPSLHGDDLPIRLVDTEGGFDIEPFYYESIAKQLFSGARRDVQTRTGEVALQWGSVYQQGITVDVPPLGDTSFNRFFERMTSPDYAWNMAFHIDGNGLTGFGLKKFLATILMPASTDNKQIFNAFKNLQAANEQGAAFVRLRITLSVEARSMEMLERASSEVISRLHSWQSCEASVAPGAAQVLACVATVPGVLSRSPSPAAAAPLKDVVAMLPWTRPAYIWDTGLPFRTADGRIFPWLQGSSQQSAFIDVGLGPMGTGKSINLNTINLGFLLTPGLVRLPMLSIADIGPSSLGLIQTIQDALPQDQRHLAQYHRIKMDAERFTVNVADLPIGLEKPFPSHESFLVNLLVLFQTPLAGSGGASPSPPQYAAGLSRAIIKRAYAQFAPHSSQAKRYHAASMSSSEDHKLVSRVVTDLGLHIDAHTTWHELVRVFFDRDMAHEAEICQRHAAPTLSEIMAFANDRPIVDTYGEENTQQYWLSGVDALAAYPILDGITRFSIDSARVVSLDLDEVAIKGSPVADRQSGVMFMLARHLLISRFFIQDTDVLLAPEHYRNYHRERVRLIRADPKRIVFDEIHRFINKDNPVVSAQVISDAGIILRESRKWNIHLGMYTQEPTDIPPDLAGMVSTVFVMGVNASEKVAQRADDLFSFGDTARTSMIRDLRKPGRAGSHMIMRMLVNNQPVTRHIMNTLGPILMWALTSTREDADLMRRMNQVMKGRVARRLLSHLYPSGTVKDIYERMREAYAEGRYLSRQDEAIYELLERRTSKQVDTLDVIYEKTLNFYEEQKRLHPDRWMD